MGLKGLTARVLRQFLTKTKRRLQRAAVCKRKTQYPKSGEPGSLPQEAIGSGSSFCRKPKLIARPAAENVLSNFLKPGAELFSCHVAPSV